MSLYITNIVILYKKNISIYRKIQYFFNDAVWYIIIENDILSHHYSTTAAAAAANYYN